MQIQKYSPITGSALKIFAIVTMFIDHFGAVAVGSGILRLSCGTCFQRALSERVCVLPASAQHRTPCLPYLLLSFGGGLYPHPKPEKIRIPPVFVYADLGDSL